jgi:hypothetical protein
MKVEFVGIDSSRIPSVQTLLRTLPQGFTLRDYLGALRQELLNRGFMVGWVEVDGSALTDGLELDLGGQPAERFEVLRLEISPTRTFVGRTFEECVRAVGHLSSLRGSITEALRDGEVGEASDQLARFADGLSVLAAAFHDGFRLLERLGIATLNDLEISQERTAALQSTLREVLDGVRRQDFVPVSDAIEYEFPEHLDGLAQEFSMWSQRLEEQQQLEERQAAGECRALPLRRAPVRQAPAKGEELDEVQTLRL